MRERENLGFNGRNLNDRVQLAVQLRVYGLHNHISHGIVKHQGCPGRPFVSRNITSTITHCRHRVNQRDLAILREQVLGADLSRPWRVPSTVPPFGVVKTSDRHARQIL